MQFMQQLQDLNMCSKMDFKNIRNITGSFSNKSIKVDELDDLIVPKKI